VRGDYGWSLIAFWEESDRKTVYSRGHRTAHLFEVALGIEGGSNSIDSNVRVGERSSLAPMITYLLPGMGADGRMYPAAWEALPNVVRVEWPVCRGECTLDEIAKRIVGEYNITDGAIVVGSSLGGMVACEIAKMREPERLVLVGSAIHKEEVNTLLRLMSPLIDLAPITFIQRLAGKVPAELTQMFERSEPAFIRAMCRAIFSWQGLAAAKVKPLRIHGRRDRVIPPPAEVDYLIDGGHLIAMTHAEECVAHLGAALGYERAGH
jgi:pimeloyl-ACP methyl ester carboxylesterase